MKIHLGIVLPPIITITAMTTDRRQSRNKAVSKASLDLRQSLFLFRPNGKGSDRADGYDELVESLELLNNVRGEA
jgi:hypothetical protein